MKRKTIKIMGIREKLLYDHLLGWYKRQAKRLAFFDSEAVNNNSK